MDVTNLREDFEARLAESHAELESGGPDVRDDQVVALEAAHELLVSALDELTDQNRT